MAMTGAAWLSGCGVAIWVRRGYVDAAWLRGCGMSILVRRGYLGAAWLCE